VRAVGVALSLAAVVAGGALAAGGEREQVHLTAVGQAAARRAVAHRSDLGAAAWKGGATTPDLSAAPTCANFHPKQHDLVLTGAAETKWRYSGLEIDTEAQVLRTPAMVAADWQRTVVAPAAIPCLRSHLVQQLGAGVSLVSFRRIAFPGVGDESRAYLLIVDVKTSSGTVGVASEVAVAGRGRTELTITSTAPAAARQVVGLADVRLARALAARAA
jgi:hypothetical protein